MEDKEPGADRPDEPGGGANGKKRPDPPSMPGDTGNDHGEPQPDKPGSTGSAKGADNAGNAGSAKGAKGADNAGNADNPNGAGDRDKAGGAESMHIADSAREPRETGADEAGACADDNSHGAELPMLMELISATVVAELNYEEAARQLVALRRVFGWAEARRAKLIAQVTSTAEAALPHTGRAATKEELSLARTAAVAEIACALNITEFTAHRLRDVSTELVVSFAATLEQIETGRISAQHAAVIIDQAHELPAEARPEFETALLAHAEGLTRPQLATRARRLRERLHPESITARRRRAACDRRLDYQPAADGMAWLSAYLPAEAGVAAYNRITAASRSLQGPAEHRTLTQLRADVFADLLLNTAGTSRERIIIRPPADRKAPDAGAQTNSSGNRAGSTVSETGDRCVIAAEAGLTGQICGDPSCAHCRWPVPEELEHRTSAGTAPPPYTGIKAEVLVTVPVFSLMGLSDEPAELEGYGPIPAHVAQELAANAPSFKRILVHPETGAMLSFGRTTYKVPADLKRMIRLRDRSCRFSCCNCSSAHVEFDHTIDWHLFGQTNYDLLGGQCKRHHRLKHLTLWDVEQPRAGTFHWKSPAGLTYTTEPEGPALGVPDPCHRPNPVLDPWRPRPPDTGTGTSSDSGSAEDTTPDNDDGDPPPF